MKHYTETQMAALRESGRILHDALDAVSRAVRAGISTLELDKIAERFIRERGGEPSFKGFQGYLFTLCTSVNEESIHGLPSAKRFLRDGDIISLDCGVRYPKGRGGMCTDAARTVAVGEVTAEVRELIKVTEGCFDAAVKGLKAGDEVGTIGRKIEVFVNGRYGIIDTYFGHGIGERIHEDPYVPNFDAYGRGNPALEKIAKTRLTEGLIICIEPMINLGTKEVRTKADGWTVVTADGKPAAHFEQTLIVHADKVEIIT